MPTSQNDPGLTLGSVQLACPPAPQCDCPAVAGNGVDTLQDHHSLGRAPPPAGLVHWSHSALSPEPTAWGQGHIEPTTSLQEDFPEPPPRKPCPRQCAHSRVQPPLCHPYLPSLIPADRGEGWHDVMPMGYRYCVTQRDTRGPLTLLATESLGLGDPEVTQPDPCPRLLLVL